MPKLVAFLILNALDGLLISIAFTGLILAANVANLRHLFLNTADGPWALGVFVIICGLTFGAAQTGLRFILSEADE